jgi:hypothetical protein
MGLLENADLLAQAGSARLLIGKRRRRNGLNHPHPLGKMESQSPLWPANATRGNPSTALYREGTALSRQTE